MSKNYLNLVEYNEVVGAALGKLGFDQDAIVSMLIARWPMNGLEVIQECQGRGLLITPAEVEIFIWDYVGPKLPDGSPIDLERVQFEPGTVEKLLTWCELSNRGKPVFSTPIKELYRQKVEPTFAPELN